MDLTLQESVKPCLSRLSCVQWSSNFLEHRSFPLKKLTLGRRKFNISTKTAAKSLNIPKTKISMQIFKNKWIWSPFYVLFYLQFEPRRWDEGRKSSHTRCIQTTWRAAELKRNWRLLFCRSFLICLNQKVSKQLRVIDKYKRKNLLLNQWRNLLQNIRTGARGSSNNENFHSGALFVILITQHAPFCWKSLLVSFPRFGASEYLNNHCKSFCDSEFNNQRICLSHALLLLSYSKINSSTQLSCLFICDYNEMPLFSLILSFAQARSRIFSFPSARSLSIYI